MALPRRVALDACALIHWTDPQSPHEQALSEWMRLGLLVGRVELSGSTALLVEARGGGLAAPNPAAEEKIRNVLLNPRFVLITLDRVTASLARQLVQSHALKTWDAVHLASAIRFDAEVLLTTDTKLLGVGSVGRLHVTKPYVPGGDHLFTPSGGNAPD